MFSSKLLFADTLLGGHPSEVPKSVRLLGLNCINSLSYLYRLMFLRQYRIYHIQGRSKKSIVRGGGCIFIYSFFARRDSFQINQFEFDLKRNLSGRTGIYENTPPPFNVVATSLTTPQKDIRIIRSVFGNGQ